MAPDEAPVDPAETEELPADYPSDWEADVVLADGGTMHLRPIRPDDVPRVERFHERQSAESVYYRYFSARPRLQRRELEQLTHLDYVDRMAFVGLIGEDLVGVARYDRFPGRSDAEVAFFTDDEHAGRGMATVMLEYLAARAREVGIARFTAMVLPQNRRMLGVFKQAGFEVTSRFEEGVIEVEFPIEPTPEALAAMEERARTAEARSVARLLEPRSIAVIGASRRRSSLGQAIVRNLIERGFEGPVYAVNPEAEVVASVRSHRSLLHVPDEIDLAVVVVPAAQVAGVVEECGRKHVRALIVISAGFSDDGEEGLAAERALVDQARRLGMRLLGPNTMGAINTSPDVRMHASFTPPTYLPGHVAVSAQSGTIGAALLDHLARSGLGISSFVATGNKADVSGNDLLQYWEEDERTDVIVLYLESFGNPRNFNRIARRVGRVKPIVALKAGRDELSPLPEGASWPADASVGALLSQTGVIRVSTLDDLLGVVRLAAQQPLPAGNRVAVLTNFWGPAMLAADACRANGLVLPELAAATCASLEEVVRPGAHGGNPVQLSAEAGAPQFAAASRVLLEAPEVDALLVLHAPPLEGGAEEVAAAVAEVAAGSGKPVVTSFLGGVSPAALTAAGRTLAGYPFPEGAALALGRMARYAAWREVEAGHVPDLGDLDTPAAEALVEAWLGEGLGDGRWVDVDRVRELLATHRIGLVPQALVDDLEAAVAAAEALGYPVALKAWGLERPAKTEAGGVAVDVHGEAELEAAYTRMVELHGPAMVPALVQKMAPAGLDLSIVAHQHPDLGSVLTVGPFGSEPTDLRIVPLTDLDADRLLGEGEMAAYLAPLDEEARRGLRDLLLRVSALVDAVPEISFLCLAPVMVGAGGVHPTDARLRLSAWHHDPAIRRLRGPT